MIPDTHWLMINRPATLVFRTVHFDRAGETSDHRIVHAEVADVRPDGTAVLATQDDIPVILPVASLFAVSPAERLEAQSFIAGQELRRDFHPSGNRPRTVLRWLDRPEVEALLGSLNSDSDR